MLMFLQLAMIANEPSSFAAPATRLEKLVVQGDVAATRELEKWVDRSHVDEQKMAEQLALSGFTRGKLDDCTVFNYSGEERRTRADRAAHIFLCPGKRPTVSVLTTLPSFVAPNPLPTITPIQSDGDLK
jgi:hypothetical protein